MTCHRLLSTLIIFSTIAFAPRTNALENKASPERTAALEHYKPKPLGLTVEQAIKKYGPDAKARLADAFKKARVAYPPEHIKLLCLKNEKVLMLFATDSDGQQKLIKKYAVVSASGVAGPKLKEGDMQVPEGFYKVTRLDAMTHLAMWLNYPNPRDKAYAKKDHHTGLGSSIQIHAGIFSTGCVVITSGDMAELVVIANDIGCKNVDVIIAPCNLVTTKPAVDFKTQPAWLPSLYKGLKTALIPLNLK